MLVLANCQRASSRLTGCRSLQCGRPRAPRKRGTAVRLETGHASARPATERPLHVTSAFALSEERRERLSVHLLIMAECSVVCLIAWAEQVHAVPTPCDDRIVAKAGAARLGAPKRGREELHRNGPLSRAFAPVRGKAVRSFPCE